MGGIVSGTNCTETRNDARVKEERIPSRARQNRVRGLALLKGVLNWHARRGEARGYEQKDQQQDYNDPEAAREDVRRQLEAHDDQTGPEA